MLALVLLGFSISTATFAHDLYVENCVCLATKNSHKTVLSYADVGMTVIASFVSIYLKTFVVFPSILIVVAVASTSLVLIAFKEIDNKLRTEYFHL